MGRAVFLASLLLLAWLQGGCALRSPSGPDVHPSTDHTTRPGGAVEAGAQADAPSSAEASPKGTGQALPHSPPVVWSGLYRATVGTLEETDPQLRQLLAAAQTAPSPDLYRSIATRYLSLDVRDRAYDYLTQALTLDGTDAAAYALRARVWYAWGFLGHALGDAHRAAHFAPASAWAHHTVAVVLMAIGQMDEARGFLDRASQLAPSNPDIETSRCELARMLADDILTARSCPGVTASRVGASR